MRKTDDIKLKISKLAGGKPAALFGCGASSKAVARLLKECSVESVCYQENGTNHAVKNSAIVENFDDFQAKQHSLVVYSPAFRPDHKWNQIARKNACTTLCEPDFAALCFGGKIIAVTGTDGKTTTTSFITHALCHIGIDAFSAGNIGEPLSNFCAKFLEDGVDDSEKIAVCELSSFQTASLKNLSPDALVWTNFAPDHLDWHIDMQEYFRAKFNLVEKLHAQDGGKKIFVCGPDIAKFAKQFSICLPDFAEILDFDKLREKGELDFPAPFTSFVQAQNFAVAKKLWQKLDFPEDKLFEAAKTFELPNFRFGKNCKISGVDFYNDSKATNAHSAIAAIKELGNRENLIWIGGGKDKFCSLDELVQTLQKTAKGAVLIGQTAQKLAERLQTLPLGAHICDSLEQAVEKSYELVKGKNDAAVLFSPAFSSFGMFSGYVERGKSFENALLCLKNLK